MGVSADIKVGMLLGRLEQANQTAGKAAQLGSVLTDEERRKLHDAWTAICDVEDSVRRRSGL